MKQRKIFAILAMVLVLVLSVGVFAACNPKEDGNKDQTDPDAERLEQYLAESAKIYGEQLGDFKAAYEKAVAETKNTSKRYALMALAEAKLMESAVFIPGSANGGTYAISKVAPNTISSVLWGNDSDRFHNAILADKLITAADRTALKAKWSTMREEGKTAKDYETAVKAYFSEHGYSVKTTYNMGYASDPQTWDAQATSRAADSEAIVNTYDSLMEYDAFNVLQYALAENHTVSDDGLTYTFTLRKGVKWVNSKGQEIAELKADDFVAGFQHMLDAKGGLEYLVEGVIVNAAEYNAKAVTFDKVGVKADGDYKVVYTLTEPKSYFLTMLGYNVFAPLCRSFYESQGGKFGSEFDAADTAYKYGKTQDNIAYCGPYVVTTNTAKSEIVFTKNESYWNKANINLDKITWKYNDGKDNLKAYNDTKSGTLDGAGLNATSAAQAKKDTVDGKTYFDEYHYVTATDATAFGTFFNINRTAYANAQDGKLQTAKDSAEQARTKAALSNVHFRRALAMALDRTSYNAQTVGADLASVSLINSFTPGNFVSLTEDVTVSINGKDTTFKKGTYYGAIMQAQIDADEVKIKVWDPTADEGAGSSAGFDGWYNAENAMAELKIAIAELKAQGVDLVVKKDGKDTPVPIHLDLPAFISSQIYYNRAFSYKKSLSDALGGYVTVDLAGATTSGDWYNAGYYTDFGYQANYDLYDVSGWGPDFGDPSSYLDTLTEGGYMAKCLGIF